MPRLNPILFAIYVVVAIALTVGAVLSPVVRAVTPAPVRDALLPVPQPMVVSLLYSTEKDGWLKDAIAGFEATRPTLNGHPIEISLKPMGSREIYLAVLDGTAKPDLISPASSLQISILQDLATRKAGVSPVNSANCRSVLKTPLVLVAWKERAEALWGASPGRDVWNRLHDILLDPKGWENYGKDWGYVKFGQTDPFKSNSGLMSILLMTYSYFNKTTGLTVNDVLNNADYQKWFQEIQGTVGQFGESTGTYMKDMVAYGPSMYDIIAVYEASVIEQAANAVGRYGELHVYYPPATVMSDHPFCVLNSEWVTPEKSQAARLFVDYLTGHAAQDLALKKYGFRPVDPTIDLQQADSPFQRYAANGLQADLSQLALVEVPRGEVLDTLLNLWSRVTQR
jgi:hypothetical protein